MEIYEWQTIHQQTGKNIRIHLSNMYMYMAYLVICNISLQHLKCEYLHSLFRPFLFRCNMDKYVWVTYKLTTWAHICVAFNETLLFHYSWLRLIRHPLNSALCLICAISLDTLHWIPILVLLIQIIRTVSLYSDGDELSVVNCTGYVCM